MKHIQFFSQTRENVIASLNTVRHGQRLAGIDNLVTYDPNPTFVTFAKGLPVGVDFGHSARVIQLPGASGMPDQAGYVLDFSVLVSGGEKFAQTTIRVPLVFWADGDDVYAEHTIAELRRVLVNGIKTILIDFAGGSPVNYAIEIGSLLRALSVDALWNLLADDESDIYEIA